MGTLLEDLFKLFSSKSNKNKSKGVFKELDVFLSNLKKLINSVYTEVSDVFKESEKETKRPSWKWADNEDETYYQDGKYKKQNANWRWKDEYSNNRQTSYQRMHESGIPYSKKVAQFYKSLEIPYGSNINQVKSAWKKLCKKYHPDFFTHDPEKQKIGNILVQKLTHAYKEIETYLKRYGKS